MSAAPPPKLVGKSVVIKLENGTKLIAPLNSLHITISDDGWISVWCNGTGMGQLTYEQSEVLRTILATG